MTSAAEGKRRLAGNAEFEARADKLQRLVVAACRSCASRPRRPHYEGAMGDGRLERLHDRRRRSNGRARAAGARLADRAPDRTGGRRPRRPALVRNLAIDLYLHPKRAPDPNDDGLHLVRLSRRWVLSGAFGRNTSKQAKEALDAAERLDAAALVAEYGKPRV